MGLQETDPLSQLTLPPGFRFYPTDEELLVQYLCKKVAGHHFSLQIIGDIDLYKFNPWDLPSKAVFGEKEWYFFSPRERKYPNGSRPNRVAGSGYWKATGTDKIITTEGRKVGIKKALVFYIGKAPKGTKTNWIMHEFRLSESPRKSGTSRLDDWVLCRIYKKNASGEKPAISGVQSKEYSHGSSSSCSSQYDDVLESLPAIDDRFSSLTSMNPMRNFPQEEQKLNLQQLGSGNFDWATLAGLSSFSEMVPAQQIDPTQNSEMITNGGNDMYTPPLPQIGSCFGEDEVQSGIRTQRMLDNSGYFPVNPSPIFSNGLDPFRVRRPTHISGSGFSQ